jgi:hypothetical protein
MRNIIKQALIRKVQVKGPRGKVQYVEEPPSQKLLYGMYFAFTALFTLTFLEAVYMLVVKSFSSEIFSAISLVIGTIMGAFFTQKI